MSISTKRYKQGRLPFSSIRPISNTVTVEMGGEVICPGQCGVLSSTLFKKIIFYFAMIKCYANKSTVSTAKWLLV
jgi:hypothetical protein